MAVNTATLPAASRVTADAANALPVGHRLHEFEVRGVIGVGGFGIVYRAFDHSLEREVAIKEYMPSALAGRSGKQQVSLLSASHSETFALGMSSFVNEAKLLARFDHPSLLKVHRFWEDNGTAYMVMPLYRGVTLRQLRHERGACPDGAWLTRLLEQLLGALEVMHREAVYHRDIAPDNIIVADNAPPVLLDFGAARRVISDRSQMLTAILKPSYAPLEQYAESTGMRQGPWTDFYALGATLHYLITGRPPVPATARAMSDEQPRLAGSAQGGVPDLLLQVCDWMLAPRPHDRPQNVAEVRAALSGHLPVPLRARPTSENAWQTTVVQPSSGERVATGFGHSELPRARGERRNSTAPLWAAAAVMVVVAAAGTWWTMGRPPAARPQIGSNTAPATGAAATTAAPSPLETSSAAAASPDAAATANDAAPPVVVDSARARPESNTVTAAPPHAPAAAARGHAGAARNADAGAAGSRPGATPTGNAAPAAASHSAAVPTATTPAAAPAVAAGPAPVAVAVATRSPREVCAGRHLLALHRCMVRECANPEHTALRECQKVRDIEARARNTLGS